MNASYSLHWTRFCFQKWSEELKEQAEVYAKKCIKHPQQPKFWKHKYVGQSVGESTFDMWVPSLFSVTLCRSLISFRRFKPLWLMIWNYQGFKPSKAKLEKWNPGRKIKSFIDELHFGFQALRALPFVQCDSFRIVDEWERQMYRYDFETNTCDGETCDNFKNVRQSQKPYFNEHFILEKTGHDNSIPDSFRRKLCKQVIKQSRRVARVLIYISDHVLWRICSRCLVGKPKSSFWDVINFGICEVKLRELNLTCFSFK